MPTLRCVIREVAAAGLASLHIEDAFFEEFPDDTALLKTLAGALHAATGLHHHLHMVERDRVTHAPSPGATLASANTASFDLRYPEDIRRVVMVRHGDVGWHVLLNRDTQSIFFDLGGGRKV